MKKSMPSHRKLTLCRDTLRFLDSGEMRHAEGANVSLTCPAATCTPTKYHVTGCSVVLTCG